MMYTRFFGDLIQQRKKHSARSSFSVLENRTFFLDIDLKRKARKQIGTRTCLELVNFVRQVYDELKNRFQNRKKYGMNEHVEVFKTEPGHISFDKVACRMIHNGTNFL